MAQIFLVRHGQRRSTDYESGLSLEGKLQSRYLAKKFKDIKLTKIYISTIERAVDTAKPIIIHHKKIPVINTDLLKEVHSSLVGGKIRTDKARLEADTKKADKAFDEIFLNAKKDDRILVVFHGNILRYFLMKILKTSTIDLWHNIHLNSASITIIEGYKKTWTIKTINNIHHLPEKYKKEFYDKEYERNKESKK